MKHWEGRESVKLVKREHRIGGRKKCDGGNEKTSGHVSENLLLLSFASSHSVQDN